MEQSVLCSVCLKPLNSSGSVNNADSGQEPSTVRCHSCEHLLRYFLGFLHGITVMTLIGKLFGSSEKPSFQEKIPVSFSSSEVRGKSVCEDSEADAASSPIEIKQEPPDSDNEISVKQEPVDSASDNEISIKQEPPDSASDDEIPDIKVFFDSNMGGEPAMKQLQENQADPELPSKTTSPPLVKILNSSGMEVVCSTFRPRRKAAKLKATSIIDPNISSVKMGNTDCMQESQNDAHQPPKKTTKLGETSLNDPPERKYAASSSAENRNEESPSDVSGVSVRTERKQLKPTKSCNICGKHYKSRAGLRGHLATHKEADLPCDICGLTFKIRASWKKHMNAHNQTARPYKCDTCPKAFTTAHHLHFHMIGKHQNGAYFRNRLKVLEEVGYTVDREATDRHLNHQCVVCGAQLTDGICQTHPSDCKLSFQCSHCEFVAKHVDDLCKHLKKHNFPLAFTASTGNFSVASDGKRDDSDLEYRCTVCNKVYHHERILAIHKKVHEEKAFSCHICSRKFTYKMNLRLHLKTHSDERPFQCDVCQEAFKTKKGLASHSLTHNLEKSPFKCHLCGKAVSRKYFLRRHYQRLHPEVTL